MSATSNITAMINGLGKAQARGIAAARKALDDGGEMILGDAQQLTPVDTGALQASGTTEPAEEQGGKITKKIAFNTDYAAAVHENLTAHHDIGQAKFLEKAVRNGGPKVTENIAKAVKDVMSGK